MQINLAKSAGFCFGVKRAIDIAFNTTESGASVYMLGDIVHNEDVAKQMQKAGIKKIGKLTRGKGKILLIRAHGAPLSIIDQAKQSGYQIIDATCPMVKEIHKIAKEMQKKGYRIIVIGDKKHNEVQGIIGQLKSKAIVIDNIKHLPFRVIKKIRKAAVVVQSTQNLEKVLEIVKALKQRIKELKFFNTICKPTQMKQAEIKTMPRENEVMIIIGSKTSANTKRLYEISKALNRHSYWIQSRKELKEKWFKGRNTIGVTSGSSTPDSTTHAVIKYIKQIT
jgi:4-hydroxy-3-methylbut-2-enyl diphosphate reductase